jgi:hypothetical protein
MRTLLGTTPGELRVRVHGVEASEAATMDRVQEIIDERRDELPVGLAKELLEACSTQPKLYRVEVTRITAVTFAYVSHEDELTSDVKMQTVTQTLIVESVGDAPKYSGVCGFLHGGWIPEAWVSMRTPCTMPIGDDEVWIVHSIKPYRKRPRE